MSDIPSAFVQRPRPPLRPAPSRAKAIRTVAAVAVVSGACFVGWRLVRPWFQSEQTKELEARQDQARARIGHGLDALFDRQLDTGERSVELVAQLDVAGGLGAGYDDSHCGLGFDDAFKEALGSDLVTFSTLGGMPGSERLEITAKITPSGTQFQLPNSNTAYPGIAMTADLVFLGKHVHADVQPAASIEFQRVLIGVPLDGPSAEDVAGGVMEGTCKQAGYALLEALTTWRRPPPPPEPDPVTECDQGFHCRENADLLAPTQPATAAKLYAKACDHDDDDACVRGAELEMSLAKGLDDHRAQAEVMLEMACTRDLPHACAASGRLKLVPLAPGEPVSAADRAEAVAGFLRACDLGLHDACAAAAPLLHGTPLADAAPLLTGAPSVRSRTLGRVFALRWGQWTKFDRGQPTAWVTAPPAHLADAALVTPFAVDHLPAGIVAPAGADMVYAVAFDKGRGQIDDRCERCMPSGGGKDMFSMRSMDCVCAIAPSPP